MKHGRKLFDLALVVLLATIITHAQMGPGMGMRRPQLRGVWNPVMGSGGAYQVEGPERTSEMEIAVVGKETVDGKPAHWLETTMKAPRSEGEVYMKSLVVSDGKLTRVTRMIMQMPGMPPMEMSMEMMQRRPTEQSADIRDEAEHVGSERVTTPAGTFECEHYRLKDGSAEVWLSEKVAPWGVVKMTGRETKMTLVRAIADAKTHITGTPQKFDPTQMMRRPPDHP